MSHHIDTNQAQHWGTGRLSGRQLLEIIVGIAVVIVLVVAAFAFISTESPVAEFAVPSEVQSVPQAESVAALNDLVSHGALDPFETQFVTPQADAATLELITHSALDPFETQFVTPQADAATPVLITHSALDPFETQFGSPQGTVVGEPSDLKVEGAAYPRPEFL